MMKTLRRILAWFRQSDTIGMIAFSFWIVRMWLLASLVLLTGLSLTLLAALMVTDTTLTMHLLGTRLRPRHRAS